MAIIRQQQFDTYKLAYYARYWDTSGAPPDVEIKCSFGTTYIGKIWFHRGSDASLYPMPSVIELDWTMNVHFGMERFRDVYQMLLHEKPLYLYINNDSGEGAVRTFLEPTGEEEPGVIGF
jgi:hypothetical protein